MPRALYLHVPFCPKICPYCDFHKMRRHEGLVARYLDRLDTEAEAVHARYPGPLDTVYFGGGTPSHLTDDELARVTATLARTWGWPAALETTLEADPLTFDAERLARFRDLGFDRVSIGLQSTQDGVLRYLGRLHDGRQGLDAVESALAAGFEVSADLITAVPQQDVGRDLHALVATGVPHISVYTLTIEPYTSFAVRGVAVDPEREADDYLRTRDALGAAGYRRYEISSHALPGHEAVHNRIYWHGEPFLALGPSAAGLLPEGPGPGVRTRNPPIKRWLEGDEPEREILTPEDYLLERLMTGLRTSEGVDLEDAEARSGLNLWEVHREGIERGRRMGLLDVQGGRLRTTEEGWMRLDSVLRELFF